MNKFVKAIFGHIGDTTRCAITTKKKYRIDDKAPSELFLDSVASSGGHGSYEMECGFCGREHLCPDVDWGGYESDLADAKNWKEHAEARHAENPEGVVLHYEYDAVSGRIVNNINFVLHCPCNGLARYETFIWEHRDIIRHFLKARIDKEVEFAEQEKSLNVLAGIDRKVTYDGRWE